MSRIDEKRKPFASRLRLAREMAGLSQGQVAKMLGLHRPSISEAEAGRRRVSSEELVELARIYGVSVDWLLGEGADETGLTQDKIELAARELAKLDKDDLDRLLQLLAALRSEGDAR